MSSLVRSSVAKSAVAAAILFALANGSWIGCSDDEDSIKLCSTSPGRSVVTEGPVLISLPAPVYPKEAAELGHEGMVIVAIVLTETGRPCNFWVKKSSGFPSLDAAALEVARGARFRAAICADGRPCVAEIQIPVRFDLD